MYHVPQTGEVVEFNTKRGLHARVQASSWDTKHGVIVSTGGLHYAVGDRSTIKPVTPAPTATPKSIKVDAPDPGKSAHRRPTVGDWVEIKNTPLYSGLVGKIDVDDHLSQPYLVRIPHGHTRWFSENQVKLTDKRPSDVLDPVADAPEPRPRTEEHLFREPPHSLTGPEETASCRLIRFIPSNTVTLPTSFASEVERAQAIADAEAEGKKWHEGSLAKYEEFAHKIAALIKEQSAVAVEDANAQQDHENRLEYLRSLRVRQDR